MSDINPAPNLLALTADIITGHAIKNAVTVDQLPELIRLVHQTLGTLRPSATPAETPRPEPAVPIRRSVTPDHVTCLECGANFSMLKRHLGSEHHLTPASYRERWGLPGDYPLVAPRYAELRSRLAKERGLGGRREEVATVPEPEPVPAPKRRGRAGSST